MGELAVPTPVLAAFAFVLGTCIGSFLNVVVWRLPRRESLVRPPSHCPKCDSEIPWWANVPIVSYLALRGRCRNCHAHISIRYPLVEALTGSVFAALLLVHGPNARLLIDWLLAAALIAVTFIDIDHQIIPNSITLPGVVLGLVLSLVAPQLGIGWRDALLGVVCIYCALWGISAGYESYSGKIGLGMGDVKLVTMLASFLGLEGALGVLILGCLVGITYGVAMLAWVKGGRDTRIPFGPALALAGLVFLFQPNLLDHFLVRP